jgi:hypothetical protein
MAHLACVGEFWRTHFIFLLTRICAGSHKVNGVAEVRLSSPNIRSGRLASSFPQLHSDLVRTTILKDFVEFYGISKYVHLTAKVAHTDCGLRRRFGNVTNGSKYYAFDVFLLLTILRSHSSSVAGPGM